MTIIIGEHQIEHKTLRNNPLYAPCQYLRVNYRPISALTGATEEALSLTLYDTLTNSETSKYTIQIKTAKQTQALFYLATT